MGSAILAYERLSNAKFLSAYLAGEVPGGLLPIDELLIEERFAEYEEQFRKLVEEKTIVAEQSGDNWHDGAFRATDSDANNLAQMVTRLNEALGLPRVEYPLPDEDRVTLGSRVELKNVASRPYILDIVGVSGVYQRGENEPEVTSLVSPVAKAVAGKRVGEVALMHRGDRSVVEISILSLDQSALQGLNPNEESER